MGGWPVLRPLGLRDGGRACMKPPEPWPSLQPGLGFPVQNSLPVRPLGLPVGEGTGTDIHSLKSALWSPRASSATVPMATTASAVGLSVAEYTTIHSRNYGRHTGILRKSFSIAKNLAF